MRACLEDGAKMSVRKQNFFGVKEVTFLSTVPFTTLPVLWHREATLKICLRGCSPSPDFTQNPSDLKSSLTQLNILTVLKQYNVTILVTDIAS